MVARSTSAHEIVGRQRELADVETFLEQASRQARTLVIAGEAGIRQPRRHARHQWTSANGHFTFAAFEGPGAGVAVIDHERGDAVVQTLSYAGRPHGVAFVRP